MRRWVARRAAAAPRRITSTTGIRAFVRADASRNWTSRRGIAVRPFEDLVLAIGRTSARARDPSGIALGPRRPLVYLFLRSPSNHFRIAPSRESHQRGSKIAPAMKIVRITSIKVSPMKITLYVEEKSDFPNFPDYRTAEERRM